eukprot:12040071-Alexandrium_andersonii.AAC.1
MRVAVQAERRGRHSPSVQWSSQAVASSLEVRHLGWRERRGPGKSACRSGSSNGRVTIDPK